MTDIQCACEPQVICQECFRRARERRRARLATADLLPAVSPLAVLEPQRALTTRDVEHRERMLMHLQLAANDAR